MAQDQKIFTLSEWLLKYAGLNFLDRDMQVAKDRLTLEINTSRCFRFLEGSNRRSPRLRAKEGNYVIMQYLGNHRFLCRTSLITKSQVDTKLGENHLRNCVSLKRQQISFIVFDETLPNLRNTRVVFDWCLSQDRTEANFDGVSLSPTGQLKLPFISSVGVNSNNSLEVFTVINSSIHFESYISCKKRFVVVVGPPCLSGSAKNGGNRPLQPSNYVFHSTDDTMKLFQLTKETGDCWSANVAFDPRPNREEMAAVIACGNDFNHLPRSGQTGSLVIYDFLQGKTTHQLRNKICHSTDLQFTSSGEQLLTSLVGEDSYSSASSSAGCVIMSDGGRNRLALLSADDLILLRVFPFPLLQRTCALLSSVVTSLVSNDRLRLAVFLKKNNNDVIRDERTRERSRLVGDDFLESISSHIDVVVVNFPSEVYDLRRLCIDVIGKAITKPEEAKYLPVPPFER